MSRDDNQNRGAVPRPPARRPTGITGSPPEVDHAALTTLSERFGVPAVDVSEIGFPLANLDLVPQEIARQHVIVPVVVRDDAVFLAMAEPTDRRVIEELEFVSGRRVFPYAATPEQLRWLIEHAYPAKEKGEQHYAGAKVAPVAEAAEPVTTNARSIAGGARPPAAPHRPPPPTPAASPTSTVVPVNLDEDDEDDLGDPDLRVVTSPMAGPGKARPGAPTLDSVFSPIPKTTASTILVVDDELDIRKMLRRVLEERGYRVLEADRGSVALAMVKQHVPDAIILDAMLPELHGFDICRRIKASVRYGHIPILMISAVYRGWRFAEDLKTAYGVNAYLEKPFRIADVVSCVEEILAGAPRADGRDPEALSAEAEAALAEGMALYKTGEIEAAIVQLEHAVKLDPLSYRVHYHLALLVGRKGDVFRAIQELETAIEIFPKSFAALKNLAVLYQKAGFKHKAIEMWERTISQSPDDETRAQIKDHLMSLL